jgi:hypothetical protein
MQRAPKWAIVFHLALALLLFSLPGLRLGIAAWHLSRQQWIVFGGLAVAYLAGALLLTVRERVRAPQWLVALLIALATFGAVTIVQVMLDYQFPRLAYVAAVVLGGVGLTIYPYASRILAPLAIFVSLAAATALALPAMTKVTIRADAPMHRESARLGTSLYDLDVTWYRNVIPSGAKFSAFGSIAEFENGYLVATGDGDLYRVKLPPDAPAQVEHLPTRVPLNIAAFDKATGQNGSGQFFRIMDVRARERNGKLQVFASHHWWNESAHCSVLRVSLLETTHEQLASTSLDGDWTTVFESRPCLPLIGKDWPFSGMEGGGRLRLLDDSTFLLTVGDHGFNGVVYPTDYVSDSSASYGKTLKVHLGGDKRVEVFTIGHRNPQGLFIDASGKVWETEHGPEGGDELNLLEAGINYGWPHVTYGTNYGKLTWPRNPHQGQHNGYRLPIYAWVPSVGTSNLIRVQKDLFAAWKDDLVVATLVGGEIFRLRLDGSRVVLTEPVKVGERVRDVLENGAGEIVLWTDSRSIAVVRPGEASARRTTSVTSPDRGQ